MSDHDALLAAVITNPDDDTPRLVMADWFQENGDEDRAEFIRVQCELARIRDAADPRQGLATNKAGDLVYSTPPEFERCMDLQRRERELLTYDNKSRWLEWAEFEEKSVPVGTLFPDYVPFSRGFVESVTCTAEHWLAHAAALHWHPSQGRPCPPTAQPIRKVVLTTWPEFGVDIEASDPPTEPPTFLVTAAQGMSEDPDAILKTLRCLYPGVEFELPVEFMSPTSVTYVRGEDVIVLPVQFQRLEPRPGIRSSAD